MRGATGSLDHGASGLPGAPALITMRHRPHARLLLIVDRLRATYWFLPAVMALSGFVAATILGWIDMARTDGAVLGALVTDQPEAARTVLSALASSIITVAGVTFSMTVVAVSFAGAQFGPRLVGNFMRDRGNQITLGMFIATFVFCLAVLRQVRDVPPFVPRIALLVALGLTLACVAVLIYFIHHVPETINVGNITCDLGQQLRRGLDHLFPESADDRPRGRVGDAGDVDAAPERAEPDARILSPIDGFVMTIDVDNLVDTARRHDLFVRVVARPGRFVIGGDVLLHVHGSHGTDERVRDELLRCLAFGRERSTQQDRLFLVDELVEILARALSPGVNDPFTAIACIRWLGVALVRMGERDDPGSVRRDADGIVRVAACGLTYAELVGAALEQSTPYVSADRNASLALMRMIGHVLTRTSDEGRRRVLRTHATALLEAAEQRLPISADRRAVAAVHRELVADTDAQRRAS